MKNIEDKIPDITYFATNAPLNTKINEVEGDPAGNSWSPGRPKEVPLQRPQDIPYRSYLTIERMFRNDVQATP